MTEQIVEAVAGTVTPNLDACESAAERQAQVQGDADLVLEDLLIEDVSIDGMCGVY